MCNVSKFQLHTCILSYTLRDLLSICLHGSYGVPMAGATSAVAISPLGRRCKSVKTDARAKNTKLQIKEYVKMRR